MKKLIILTSMVLAFVAIASADIKDTIKKAEKGDKNAQYELGTAYYNGYDVDMDAEKALVWWEKAAMQGHSEAQYDLGNAIFNGEGTDADHVKGCTWLYITTVPAANYPCTQIPASEIAKAMDAAEQMKKKIKK